ncbi:MAG: flagellar protein [Oscillospiraceae bacterium]|nr:flagellar protein [Oscillospiraceae bacterium]
MNNVFLGRMSVPITTGTPQLQPNTTAATGQDTLQSGTSFKDLLAQQLSQNSNVQFSKHAVSRVIERGIELTGEGLERLNEGVKIAQQKGLNDTLILIDRTAFIVNAQNNKVITTVSENDLKGNVFTNIDGTVIV